MGGRPVLWSLRWQKWNAKKVRAFVAEVLVPRRAGSVGVIIDHHVLSEERRPWRELLALLPEDMPAFLHLEGGELQDFPFDLLDYLHIIWESRYAAMLPVLDRHLRFSPSRRLSLALLLPGRGAPWTWVDKALEGLGRDVDKLRLIAEERLIDDVEGIDELILVRDWLSPQGERMVCGFKAAGGLVREFQGGADRPLLLENSRPYCPPFSQQIDR